MQKSKANEGGRGKKNTSDCALVHFDIPLFSSEQNVWTSGYFITSMSSLQSLSPRQAHTLWFVHCEVCQVDRKMLQPSRWLHVLVLYPPHNLTSSPCRELSSTNSDSSLWPSTRTHTHSRTPTYTHGHSDSCTSSVCFFLLTTTVC